MSQVPALADGDGVPALPRSFASASGRSGAAPRGYLDTRLRLVFGACACVQAAAAAVAATQLRGTAAVWSVGLGAAAVLMTLGAGEWVLRRVVVGTLRPATAAVRRLKAGDLRTGGARHRTEELSPLLQGVRELREQLLAIVQQVRTGTINVAMNATQVRRDNDALARRTEIQAESLQETAASMEELTAAVRQTAAIAQEAHALVRAATGNAEHGGEVMREVVATMDAIRAGSQSIREIIGVIDGIAFQTNILALNAAVEAARAGEQGRGFAVVAAEVWLLAQRCAEAAHEVKDLVRTSVEKVEGGGTRVEQAGAAMADIVSSVRKVAELIDHVHVASREQSSGIETINEAIARIDASTQDNAGLVKQGARTVTALQERAAALWKAVDVFQLGEHEHGTAQDAVALVDAGLRFMEANGLHAFLDEVNQLDFGRFVHRDLYLMVLRLEDGTFLAHGNNPARLGTGSQVRDANGKFFTREMTRLARERGEGWVDYTWEHPVTGIVSGKRGYVRRQGEVAVYAAIQVR